MPASLIPGQTDNGLELNSQLLVISVTATTVSYLMSLTWASFVKQAVIATQAATQHRIPAPVSYLFAAIIVSSVVIAILATLYRWEQRVVQNGQRSGYDEE